MQDNISLTELYDKLMEANRQQILEIKSEINKNVQELKNKVQELEIKQKVLKERCVRLERKTRKNNVCNSGDFWCKNNESPELTQRNSGPAE
ncbi:hypothetical protein JTB14_029248 [Gonioctena quinquepunctata]|nr:hypothetical protein JTB14_029248 [Gonioctena quinquepunctata]